MSATARSALAHRLLPLLDLTRLDETDPPARIEALCDSARLSELRPAAVCVYPEHVTTARRRLAGSSIRVASVVNFPDGGDDPDRIERETRRAIAAGADEIDLVLPWRAFRAGRIQAAQQGVRQCRAACSPEVVLKLIVETGELKSQALIRAACVLGIEAGVNFLKTSTGKAAINATPESADWMLEVIAENGGCCGFKAAGGIRTLDQAAVYLGLVEARLGRAWIGADRLRIGASVLHAELLTALQEA